jgi:hypothetical protein
LIGGLARYLRWQVAPRWFSIFGGSEFWVSVAVAIAFGVFIGHDRIGSAKVGDVVTALLAYAAVAFGFSLAGLTIALTLPDENFTRELATASKGAPTGNWQKLKSRVEPKSDAYSDLLFVFSWTAAANWCTVALGFGLLVAWGFDEPVIPVHPSTAHRVAAGLLVFFASYAICLFLVTLFTLSQVGRVYITQLRRRAGGPKVQSHSG